MVESGEGGVGGAGSSGGRAGGVEPAVAMAATVAGGNDGAGSSCAAVAAPPGCGISRGRVWHVASNCKDLNPDSRAEIHASFKTTGHATLLQG